MMDWNAECASPIVGKRCKLRNGFICGIVTERKPKKQFYCFIANGPMNAMNGTELMWDVQGRFLGSDTSRSIFDCIEVVD